ncbi:heat shock protein 70 family [Gigaspora rosea]|uniref:Heat shock protein 70 family n=1 Tax=Gigaspora rosea TaxID=44941 RepID=A0A397VBD8_9GLOM|nr:heat shock protein 70 family [Gigaspora rosea]
MPSATDSKKSIIGLRIGQSYSSIAIINKDGRADCIANEDGERQIPTLVAFAGEEELAGTQAKALLLSNSKNTISQFRNFIGKSFAECNSSVIKGTAQLVDKDGIPAYSVEFMNQESIFTVQEITTKYITSLRESAENFLGQPVTGVVLAIPTYFTDSQRLALKDATEKAGLRVLQLINEPTAAILTYESGIKSEEYNNNLHNDRTALILDLGSDSLDVTVMSIRSGMFTILATTHDPDLGGAAFDDLLVNHFVNEFKRKTQIDILQNKRALVKLRNAVEITKKTLSSSSTSPCSVESLADGIDFHGSINRTRFEIMSNKLFTRILDVISNTLKENNLDTQLIDEVILVGGASRIPKLQSKLRDTFNNTITVIRQDFEPDEVVAYGCAFQGDLIGDLDDQMISDSIDSSVTLVPHLSKPIGILNAENNFVVIIPGNTPLPARRIFQSSNMFDDQKKFYVPIWEGDIIVPKPSSQTDNNLENDSTLQERPNLSPVKLLAELVLTDLPEKKINELKVDITIEIDINQKCIILAKELTSNKSVEIEIQITQ